MSPPDFDDDDIDVCVSCGRYYGWQSMQDLIDAYPTRPVPQLCRRCWPEEDPKLGDAA